MKRKYFDDEVKKSAFKNLKKFLTYSKYGGF